MGLEELIEATAQLADVPRLRVAIAGSGPLRDRLLAGSSRGRRRDARRAARPGQRRRSGRLVPGCGPVRAADARVRGLRDGDDRGARERDARRRHAGRRDPGAARAARRAVARDGHDRRRDSRLRSAAALALLTPELRERAARSRSSGTPGKPRSRPGSASSRRRLPRAPPARRALVVRTARALDRHVPVDLKATRDGLVAQARETTGLAVRVEPPSGRDAAARRREAARGSCSTTTRNRRRSNGTSTISPSTTVSCRTRRSPTLFARATGRRCPPKSLAVTFDDGHAGNAALHPGARAVRRARDDLHLHRDRRVRTGATGGRSTSSSAKERDRLMNVPETERLARLAELAGWTPDTRVRAARLRRSRPTSSQRARGQASRSRRTRGSHPILTMCDDEQALAEIAGSKARRRAPDRRALHGIRLSERPLRHAGARARRARRLSVGAHDRDGLERPRDRSVPAARPRNARRRLAQRRRGPEHRVAGPPRSDVPLMSDVPAADTSTVATQASDLLVVVGARPNFMKAASILPAARAAGMTTTLSAHGSALRRRPLADLLRGARARRARRLTRGRLGQPRRADGTGDDRVRARAAADPTRAPSSWSATSTRRSPARWSRSRSTIPSLTSRPVSAVTTRGCRRRSTGG